VATGASCCWCRPPEPRAGAYGFWASSSSCWASLELLLGLVRNRAARVLGVLHGLVDRFLVGVLERVLDLLLGVVDDLVGLILGVVAATRPDGAAGGDRPRGRRR